MSLYFLTRMSPKNRKPQSVEIQEKDFPPELLTRRPDQDDALSTRMSGYALERVALLFRSNIIDGQVVYSIISDDWRLTSWLKAS